MGLNKSSDYKTLIMTEMTKVTDLYLKLKQYSGILTPGYEEVFYNANRDLNYQTMLIISAIRSDDSDEDVKRKIQMVSKFVDIFASIRIFNFKNVNWNTNKYLLFRVMKNIRNQDCKSVGMALVRALRRMDASIDAITKFSLNQFSGRYMLHLLARFTSYVNVRMGNPSQFDVYVDRKRKGNTYDIEHILPDDYDSYSDEFPDADEFQTNRQMTKTVQADLGLDVGEPPARRSAALPETYDLFMSGMTGDMVLCRSYAVSNDLLTKIIVRKYRSPAIWRSPAPRPATIPCHGVSRPGTHPCFPYRLLDFRGD